MKPHQFLSAVIVAICLAFVASVNTGCTSAGGVKSSAVVFSFAVTDADGHATGVGRTDLNTSVIFGQGTVSAEVFQKPSPTMPNGLPLFGPIGVEVGKVYVFDRARDVRVTLNIGEPLPAFVAVLFRPGEAEALGLVIAPE